MHMAKKLTPPPTPAPITSSRIKHLSGVGLATPSKLTNKQTQELAGSVLAHIEPRGKAKK
jgi:hypothetical protein